MYSVFQSLKRAALRLIMLVVLGALFINVAESFPTLFGELGAPLLRGFGLCFLGLAIGDFALRILQPHVNTAQCAEDAIANKNLASAIVYFGRCFLAGIVLFLIVTASRAGEVEQMPVNAVKYSPLLVKESRTYWQDLLMISTLGSQVEQETCISLKNKYCWSPEAQLKTSREQGVGLSQLTRTFKSDGTIRFDVLTEMTNKYPKELKGLSWSNWKDPDLQLRALVLSMRDRSKTFKNTGKTQLDDLAFTFASYNAGVTSVSNSKLACRAKKGCDSSVWFNNVELASIQSKVAIKGYGQSPYEITTSYVRNILQVRRQRYLSLDIKRTA